VKQNVRVSKKLLVINSASAVFSRVINLSILLWLQAYLLTHISADEFEIYPIIAAVTSFIFIIRLVFVTGISRFTINAYAQGDFDKVTRTTSTMFVLVLIGGAIVLVPGALLVAYIDTALDIRPDMVPDAQIMLGFMIASFVTQLALSPFEAGIYIKQKFLARNAILTVQGFLRILILLALLFGISTRVIWVVVATETATLAGFFVLLYLSTRAVPQLRFRRSMVDMSLTKELMSFGVWNLAGQIGHRIIMSADPIILNRLGTAADVNAFHVGSLFHRQLHQSIQVVAQPLVPIVTAMHATGDSVRLGNTFLRYGRYYTWLFLLVATPLVVFRAEFIDLYLGGGYPIAATVILLLLTESVLSLGAFMLYSLAIATGRMRELSIRIIITQACNLGLTLYLVGILKMGAIGCALSTFITHMISGPFLEIPLGLQLAGVGMKRYWREVILPGYAPMLTTIATLYLISYLYHPPATWMELCILSATGCCIYLVTLFLSMQRDDKRDAAAILVNIKLVGVSKRLFGDDK
jgi:O-antigen/teichoic acid export membrane protein